MIQTTTDTYVLPAALPLEEGGLLMNAKVAYEAYGRRSPDNAVVLLHDLHHTHRALGASESSPYQPSGWARELVGEGKLLRPRETFVVSVNLLGSPYGSTSPATLDDDTKEPLGPIFPPITALDMARSVSGLLRGLGVRRVRAIIGVGMGGMVALRLAAAFRDLTAGVVTLGATRMLSEPLRTQLAQAPQLLAADPLYDDGRYPRGGGPRQTVKQLRLEFLRQVIVAGGSRDAAKLALRLDAEAEAFAERFDPNCYALLAQSLGRTDLTDALDRISAKVLLVAAETDGLAPPARVKDTYHLLAASGVHVDFHELREAPAFIAGPLSSALHAPLAEFLASVER